MAVVARRIAVITGPNRTRRSAESGPTWTTTGDGPAVSMSARRSSRPTRPRIEAVASAGGRGNSNSADRSLGMVVFTEDSAPDA